MAQKHLEIAIEFEPKAWRSQRCAHMSSAVAVCVAVVVATCLVVPWGSGPRVQETFPGGQALGSRMLLKWKGMCEFESTFWGSSPGVQELFPGGQVLGSKKRFLGGQALGSRIIKFGIVRTLVCDFN